MDKRKHPYYTERARQWALLNDKGMTIHAIADMYHYAPKTVSVAIKSIREANKVKTKLKKMFTSNDSDFYLYYETNVLDIEEYWWSRDDDGFMVLTLDYQGQKQVSIELIDNKTALEKLLFALNTNFTKVIFSKKFKNILANQNKEYLTRFANAISKVETKITER